MALIHKRFAHRQKPNNARGVSRLPGGTQADIMYLFDEGSGSPIDLVSNAKPLDFLGSAGWEASQKGIGVFSPAAGADHGLVQAGNRIGNGASSLAIFGQYTPLNINDALVARWGASGALSWILTHNSNGLALAVTDSSTTATAGEGRYTNPLTIGKEYTFFFSWDGTTNFRCFLNGEKVALNVWWSNGLTSISNGNSDLYLLRHGSSGTSGKYNVRFAGMYVDKFVPDSVAESITREPYRHIYQPRRRWVPVVIQGGAGATVSLFGASGTGQVGNINSIGAALLTLAGASASGQAGTITVTTTSGATITLSGVSGTGDAGLLSATGAALLTATGAQGTGQSGTLSATGGARFNLGGIQATGQPGSVTSLGGALSGLIGVSSEGQPGTVTIQVAGGVSITLSGTQTTGQAGTLTAITGASFALSGVASTGQAGTLTVTTVEGATVTLTGVQAAGGAGDIGILTGATVTLSGAVGTGQSGTVTVTIPGAITIDLTFKTAFVLSAEDTSLTLQ